MKSSLSYCDSNWLKESASVAQFWNAAALALHNPFLLRWTAVVSHRPAIVTERPAHRDFRAVFVERNVDRRFQFRRGVRLQQISERA